MRVDNSDSDSSSKATSHLKSEENKLSQQENPTQPKKVLENYLASSVNKLNISGDSDSITEEDLLARQVTSTSNKSRSRLFVTRQLIERHLIEMTLD